jgi:helix-turn-helix protein
MMPGVEENPSADEIGGGEHAAETRHDSAEAVSESGWVTTEVAAEALGVSPRTVRDYISGGKLQAKPEGEGVERRWLISIDSVQALRQTRRNAGQAAGRSPRAAAAEPRGGEPAANIAADLLISVQDLQYKLGRAEARAEITERAESTVREERDRLLDDLERERRRADQERERAQGLEAELRALRETRESPVSPGPSESPTPTAAGPHATTEGPQPTGPSRSLWRRIFGG